MNINYILWKGRLSFKQYVSLKRRQFGIKLFIRCDCETKYLLDFVACTGANTEIEMIHSLGVLGLFMMTLMKLYPQKARILYVDILVHKPPAVFAAL